MPQQHERFRRPWPSAFLFTMAAVLAVGGVLLLLPPRAPGAPIHPIHPIHPILSAEDTDVVGEADGRRDARDASARGRFQHNAERLAGQPPGSGSPGPPVRVRVDAIDVDARIVPLGLEADGHLQVPDDFSAAGWWDGGGRPGEAGPMVVVGHVDSYRGPAVFYRLRDLEIGDEVVLTAEGGESVSYTVTATHEASKQDFPTEAVYGHTAGPTLRLVTCGGPFDEDTGHYRHNIIVFAEHSAGA